MEEDRQFNNHLPVPQKNSDLQFNDGFDELEDLVKSLEIDIPSECTTVSASEFINFRDNDVENISSHQNSNNIQTKSTNVLTREVSYDNELYSFKDSSNYNVFSIDDLRKNGSTILEQLKNNDSVAKWFERFFQHIFGWSIFCMDVLLVFIHELVL